MDEKAASFADLLRGFRNRIELTQEELAERAGLSPDAVGLLERGERRRPHTDTVARLAAALELSAAERAQVEAAARRPAPLVAQTGQAQLPLPLTPLVGRAKAVDAVAGLFDQAAARLVTLTGPGGVGKTRLALTVAERLGRAFADGVVFVPLAALASPDRVLTAIAAALGLHERAGQTVQQRLIQTLQSRRALLVLDNFEHLLPAAALVSELLAACPRLAVLATSRAPLNLLGERQYAVPPLELPATWQEAPLERLRDVPVVVLFEQRAQAVAPHFAVTAANGETVLAICRRLDGLPLAIELAAAWAKVLPLQTLLERLDRRLPLLVGGPHDLPERQRTMQKTIAWSYDLLSERAQRLLSRLAVFVGGFTLAAAEAVGATDAEPQGVVLASLAELLDASLLQAFHDAPLVWEERGTPRYTMLETVREFALERLSASGEDVQAHDRHRSYYLGFAETHAPNLVGANAVVTLARFTEEQPNLRAALQSAIDHRDTKVVTRFGVALWRFWVWHGYIQEGRTWLESALDSCEGAHPSPAQSATLLQITGNVSRIQTDYVRAHELFTAALAIRRELDDRHGVASCLHNLGIIADDQGEYTRAETLHAEALEIARLLDDRHALSFVLASLGDALQAQGRTDEAAARYEESLALARRLQYRWGIGYALTGLGDLHRARGAVAVSLAHYQESLTLHMQIGNKLGIAACLGGLARLAGEYGSPEHVAQLLGAAAAVREHVGAPRAPAEALIDHQARATALAALGEDGFARNWDAGRRAPLAHLAREVLRVSA